MGFNFDQDIAKQQQLQQQNDAYKRALDQAQQMGAGYVSVAPTEAEIQAGVIPPGYSGLVNPKTGELLDQYKYNPFTGEAAQRLRGEALGTGPSEFAKAQLAAQKYDQQRAMNQAGLQQQAAQSGAMSNLARMGGLGGGARTSLARSGARDLLAAQQGVGAQGIQSRFGINANDLQRRQELLGQTAALEQGSQLQNIGTTKEDLLARNAFNTNRYNQQMQQWAAGKSADAQAAAARSSGGGKK